MTLGNNSTRTLQSSGRLLKPTLTGLAAAALLTLTAPAQIRETPAVIALQTGANPQGFVQGGNQEGIFFSPSSGGRAQLVPYATIRGEGLNKLVRLQQREELLAEGRAHYAAEDFSAAADSFGKIAVDYQFLAGLPLNFASEAAFYQLESLHRSGRIEEMQAVVESPAARAIPTRLSAAYQTLHLVQKKWALLGAQRWDDLKKEVAAFEIPPEGDAAKLRSPNFQPLPPNQLAPLAYFRGRLYRHSGEKERAIDDFYRAFSLAYGNDKALAQQAMEAALELHTEDPGFAANQDRILGQVNGLAYLHALRFGREQVPEAVRDLATRPEMTQLPMAGSKPADKPKE